MSSRDAGQVMLFAALILAIILAAAIAGSLQ